MTVYMWKDNENNLTIERDDDDFLKDGQIQRVRMMARDSVCPICSNKGLRADGTPCPICDAGEVQAALQNMTTHTEGIASANTAGDRASLTDHQKFMLQDQEWRAATAGSRPGYRFAANTKDHAAARQKLVDSYTAYETEKQNEWRHLRSDAGEFTAGQNAEPNVGAGSEARRIANPEGGAKEGDPCMDDDKRHGTLRRTAAGDLVCVANGSNEDHRTVLDKMADHRRIMQTEYEQYNRQQSEAYRNLK